MTTSSTAYLAGPMRGYDLYNFPAFHEAARRLRRGGWKITSPAEHDNEVGFDETGGLENFDLKAAIFWDLTVVAETDAVIVLPGYRKSSGVRVEKALADFLNHPVYEYKPDGYDSYRLRLVGTKEWV